MMGKAITSLMMAFVTLCLYAQERQQDVDSVGQTNVIGSGDKVHGTGDTGGRKRPLLISIETISMQMWNGCKSERSLS